MGLPFKTGMIYRSETHPQFDMIIDFVQYQIDCTGKIEKYGTVICWCNINRKLFFEFVNLKLGKNRKSNSTFPYSFYGECSVDSLKQRLKKYNLKFVGMSDDKITIYKDDEYEYCSGFDDKCSALSK